MKIEVLADGVDGHDEAGQAFGQAERGTQVFVVAMIAPDAGEAVFQVAAVEELVDDFRDDGPQEAVAGLIALLVAGEERIEMTGQALPERRRLGLSGTIDLRGN